jgi:hypothetical protein
MTILCVLDMCTPSCLCIPQHSKQINTPKLVDSHSGSEIKKKNLSALKLIVIFEV